MRSICADGVKGPGTLIGQQIDALQAIMELRPYSTARSNSIVDGLEVHFERVESVADLLAFADGAENHAVSLFGTEIVAQFMKADGGARWPGPWHVRKEIERLWPVFDDNFARDLAGGDPMGGVLNSMRVGLGKKVNDLLVEKPDFSFNAS